MKKQVVFIHGGEAFSSYDAFIEQLKNEAIDPFEKKEKRWHQTLGETLGPDFEVFLPQMPNAENAKYLEWRIWFEKYIAFLRDEVVLIGHSQGGYFLVKYLIENVLPVSIKALYLVAAPFEPDDFSGEDGGDFSFDRTKVSTLETRVPKIVVFHSKDDFVVPFEHALQYQEGLSGSKLHIFEDRGHFLQEEFPELIELIKGLG